MSYRRVAVILGNCLFPSHQDLHPDKETLFFMAEDEGLCTHFSYHKQKLVLFLSAMRSHADEIEKNHKLVYHKLSKNNRHKTYEDKLDELLRQYTGIEELVMYDVEDHFFRERILRWARANKLEVNFVASPLFITSQQEFAGWLRDNKPSMQSFYQWQRQRLNILVNQDGSPKRGKWSFDKANRKPLPKNISIPEQPNSGLTDHDRDVIELVNELFPVHPGSTENFNWSTTRGSALAKLNDFLKSRFEDFGPYEDAIDKGDNFLFHSVLSPYLNIGLITPDEVIDKVLEHADEHNTHFPSVEGYVRQVIGWREFMRGIYNNYELDKNKFNHQRKMKDCWYDGSTGIAPLDDSIKKAVQYGYTHHIERLMILGNIMLLTGLHPQEVYKWFMEMYVDSSDWVMAPNVYGMSQFAEGGIFATKPYIGGSNYILKMSNYRKAEWCDTVDGLYWRFIDRKRKTIKNNYRMGMMIGTLDKMKEERKSYLFAKADKWIEKVSYA